MAMHPLVQSPQTLLRYLPIVAFLLVAGPVHSEAIPVTPDRKDVTVDSFTIPLNEAQVKQVEQLRTLTLTGEQMAPLWAMYDKTPQTIDVVSSQYDSCTCGMGVYGIWCRPGEIKIPWGSVEAEIVKDTRGAENPDLEEDTEQEPNSNNHESTRVILDSAGKTYLDGKERREADVLALIDALCDRQKQNDWLSFWITLDVPPPIDDATDARIRELAKRIEARCKERNIGFWGLGISADKYR